MSWRVFQGSAKGSHHVEQNLPCQDYAYSHQQNQWFVAVVCDGAGSASQSDQGAQFFAQTITEKVLLASQDILWSMDTLTPILTNIIAISREQLQQQLTEGFTLRDHAATLVGCIMNSQGGCFFHIGDGFAVYQEEGQPALVSLPENGEYASETYFVTGEDWQQHLRVVLLPPPTQGSYLGLMSDGAATFAINKQRNGFFPAFIDPVLSYLSKVDEVTGNAALNNLLDSPKTTEITSDDKTLLLAAFS